MATARTIIKAAMLKLGVLSVGEAIQNEDAQHGLQALNMMLGSWSTTKLTIPFETQTAMTISGNPTTLTVRPMSVVGGMISDGGTDYPVDPLTDADYFAISDKGGLVQPSLPGDGVFGGPDVGGGAKVGGTSSGRTGRPTHVWWDQKFPASSLVFYPAPDRAYNFTLRSWSRLTSLGKLDDEIVLPGEYELALVYNLAVVLAPDYGRSVPAEVAVVAKDSLDTIQKYHSGSPPTLTSDLVSVPRAGDWRTVGDFMGGR